MKKTNIGIATFLGFISGLLSWFLSEFFEATMFSPGICFGVFFGIYLSYFSNYKLSFLKFLILVVLSVVAYFVAFWVTVYTSILLNNGSGYSPFSFIIGGLVGSALVGIAFTVFVKKTEKSFWIQLLLVGGCFSLFWQVGEYIKTILYPSYLIDFPSLTLFVVWQTAIMTILALFQSKNDF